MDIFFRLQILNVLLISNVNKNVALRDYRMNYTDASNVELIG